MMTGLQPDLTSLRHNLSIFLIENYTMSEVKYVSRMIQRRDWNNVCNTLRLMPDAYAGATIKTKHDVASEAIVSVTLLHLALMLNPPLSLVAQFIAIDSTILEVKDTIGRTPLHIAIMHKANPQVRNRIGNIYFCFYSLSHLLQSTP